MIDRLDLLFPGVHRHPGTRRRHCYEEVCLFVAKPKVAGWPLSRPAASQNADKSAPPHGHRMPRKLIMGYDMLDLSQRLYVVCLEKSDASLQDMASSPGGSPLSTPWARPLLSLA